MKEKIGNLWILLTLLATLLPSQTWRGDEAVAVQVNDSKGRSVAKARVVFTFQGIPGETGPDVVATNDNGRAVLTDLAPGPWQVEVSHPDYLSYIAMLEVRRGKKPQVSASFLEASGKSLSPVKVKFSKGDQQQASPAIEARQELEPPAAVTPTAEDSRATVPQIAEPPAPAPLPPADPELESVVPEPVPEPQRPPETPPEPTVEAPPPTESTAEPAPVPEPVAATPAPPEPEPAAQEPREVESTASQIPAVESEVKEAAAPVVETHTTEPELEEVVGAASATAPVPDPVPEPGQEPDAMEIVAEEDSTPEPETPEISPQPQPSTPSPKPEDQPQPISADPPVDLAQESAETPPAPPVVTAPAPARAALPPPPDSGALVTSHSDGSCQDCESAEWTLRVSVAAPAMDPGSAGRCDSEVLEAARAAMQGLSTSIQLELDGFIGPVANGSPQEAIRRVEPDLAAAFGDELAAFTGGRSPCQIIGLVLPKAVRFSRVQLAAGDQEAVSACAPGQTCAIGDAAWLGSARVERGPSATVVYGLFENRSADRGRRAILTAYYRPPNANWKPRLPAAD